MTIAQIRELIVSKTKITFAQYREILSAIRHNCYVGASEAYDIDDVLGMRFYQGGEEALTLVIGLSESIELEPSTLTTDEITFLYSVIKYLNAKGTFTIKGNVVTLRYKAKGQHEITTHFNKDLLEKYYNRPCSFITEVL